MERTVTNTTDVLIVGAGPTGMALGSELLRRGLHCRIIDKLGAYATSTRGHALQPRTLEVLDFMGIADKMLAVGSTTWRTKFFNGGQLVLELDSDIGPRPDAPYLSSLLSRQPHIERVLRDHFVSLGGVVELASELTDLRDEGDAVIATVNRTVAGTTERIRAAYVVGCDGGHSLVRKCLGLTFDGETVAEHFVLCDAELDWNLDSSGDQTYWFLHEDGMLLAATYGDAPMWSLFAQISANADGDIEPASAELFSRLILKRTGLPNVHLTNVTWVSNYSINRRLASHYRRGRVFIAGDAAHIHSPSGGQGMNTGIQDAFNLAWKLALVFKGKAGDALLDTYEEERRPIAQALMSSTSTSDSALFSHTPVMAFVRNRLATPLLKQPAIREMLFYKLAQLNVNYRKSSLAQSYESPLGQITLAPAKHLPEFHLREWFDFQSAPHAGDRAPQAQGRLYPSQEAVSLFEALRSGKFTLLLFYGAVCADDDCAHLVALTQRVTDLVGDEIETYLVIAGDEKPAHLEWNGVILLDPSHELHKMYGASAETVYLIRPDGYVGFRTQSFDEGSLVAYLGKVFLQYEVTEGSR